MKLGANTVALGGWCTIPSSLSFEMMTRTGFDWLCFDLQHTFVDLSTATAMLQASKGTSAPVLVRTSSHEAAELQHMLDAGAAGVIAPMVNTAEQARRIVEACRYSPDGHRSWGPVRAALSYDHYTTAQANNDVICGIMIETVEGLENIDEILSVDGVDLVLVGPNDLAIDLGDAPAHGIVSKRHGEAIAKIAERCEAHGVVSAIQGGDVPGALQFIEMGYRAVLVATDLALVVDGARAALREAREGSTRSAHN